MNQVPILARCCPARSWRAGREHRFLQHLCGVRGAAEDRKAELEGLRVIHSAWTSLFYYDPEPSLQLKECSGSANRKLRWCGSTAAGASR